MRFPLLRRALNISLVFACMRICRPLLSTALLSPSLWNGSSRVEASKQSHLQHQQMSVDSMRAIHSIIKITA
jgi:hypothetical protein